MALYDYGLAGNDTLGTYAPNQLITGELKVTTKRYAIEAGLVLDKYTVMSRNTAGNLVALDTTQTDGRQTPVAILMTAINTTAAAAATPLGVALPANPAGAVATYDECYDGGCFNPNMLIWPTALTDPKARARLFDRTPLSILSPL